LQAKQNHEIKGSEYRYYTNFIRSTPPSRANKVGLRCPSVRLSIRTFVRPSTKRFFDFDEIWYVGRGRRVMHDGMQYDLVKVTSP